MKPLRVFLHSQWPRDYYVVQLKLLQNVSPEMQDTTTLAS